MGELVADDIIKGVACAKYYSAAIPRCVFIGAAGLAAAIVYYGNQIDALIIDAIETKIVEVEGIGIP
jgi:hypothetical protein